MFLEQYKHSFNKENIFENNSINDNPLFGLKQFYSNEYLKSTYNIPVKLINDFTSELEDTLNKYLFINSYLESYIKQLNEESIKLDKEFNEINSNISVKGQSFLSMFNLNDNYNYVFDENIVYSKNVLDNDNSYIKNDETLTEIPYYIEYINDFSFFITFENMHNIKDIFLDFYQSISYSIFGANENNILEIIYDKVNSEQNLFSIKDKKKYKKLYIVSNSPITKFIKKIKIYEYSKNNEVKYGYIIRKLNSLNKFSDLIFINDSGTNFYLYDEQQYKKVINDIGKNGKSNFISENYKVVKNKNIKNNFKDNEMYLLEFFNINDNISFKTKIYGKEAISEHKL